MERVATQPDRFGKYTILERVGVGGMSEVFLAKTEGIEGFERKVALKRIFPDLTAHEEFVRSFIHEARIGGMLYHHNVVQTLDFGKVNGTYYIALEYIEGTHVGQILHKCREKRVYLPPGIFMQLALQILEGLEYIHHAQVEGEDLKLVHRDIKPSNMLVSAQGVVKISDFGVVKAESQVDGRTRVGAVKGTIGYMAPEQARGHTIGPAADLYAFGAMMYEMATLKRIYGQGDEIVILKRVRDGEFMEPIEAASRCVPGLDVIIRRLLSNEPKDRYAEASDITDALRALGQPSADRKTVVQFIKELGLLDPDTRESGQRRVVLNAETVPIPVRVSGGNQAAASSAAGGSGGAEAGALAAAQTPGGHGQAAPQAAGNTPGGNNASAAILTPPGGTFPQMLSLAPHAPHHGPGNAGAGGVQGTMTADRAAGMPIPPARQSAGPSIVRGLPVRSSAPRYQDWGMGFAVAVLGLIVALGTYFAVDALLAPPQSTVPGAPNLPPPLPGDVPLPQEEAQRIPPSQEPIVQQPRPADAVWLNLDAQPRGAEILLDGVLFPNRAPASVPVRPGQQIVLRLPGYKEWQQTVPPGLPDGQTLSIQLEPQ